jgi:hypothetical protein
MVVGLKLECSQKVAKMKRAFARVECINRNTRNRISTADARDAAEDLVSHAYHFKSFPKKEFRARAQRIEEHITSHRELSLVADLQNSSKLAEGIEERRKKHEKETGSPVIRDLVRINICTTLDEETWTGSQRLEITFQNAKLDTYDLAVKAVKAWDDLFAAEGIDLAEPYVVVAVIEAYANRFRDRGARPARYRPNNGLQRMAGSTFAPTQPLGRPTSGLPAAGLAAV